MDDNTKFEPVTPSGQELLVRLAGRGLSDYPEIEQLVLQAEAEAVQIWLTSVRQEAETEEDV